MPAGEPYVGEIAVRRLEYQSQSSQTATASFVLGVPPRDQSCPVSGVTVGDCCCVARGLALPGPQPVAPNVGKITISLADGGAVVAELTPRPPTDVLFPGQYDSVDCSPWDPGAALRLSAAGADVGAFSARLLTASRFEGVSFSMGVQSGVADTHVGWDVTWMPEDTPAQSVTVLVATAGKQCSCTVPDARGRVSIAPELTQTLAPNETWGTGLSGTVGITRVRTELLIIDDATIVLESEQAEANDVAFE